MMCPTKTLVRSFVSGLLLMGVSIVGVSQAGATAFGGAEIGAELSIGIPSGVGEVASFADYSFTIDISNGDAGTDTAAGADSSGEGNVSSGAMALAGSGPGAGSAFGLGVGIGTIYVGNYTDTGVVLPVELSYSWIIEGEATTPLDFAAAGVGLFVVIESAESSIDWSSVGADLGVDTLDIDGVDIIPVLGVLDYTSPDFEYGDDDTIYSDLYLGAYEAVSVSLVSIAGAEANTVPEPASVVLMSSGLLGLVAWRMKKKPTV